MTTKSQLNLATLSDIYAVSNTPTYLYRHFRTDSSVQHLGKIEPTEDLMALARHICTQEGKTLSDIVAIYASLVALSFKPLNEIKDATAREIPQIRWASELINLAAAEASTATFTLEDRSVSSSITLSQGPQLTESTYNIVDVPPIQQAKVADANPDTTSTTQYQIFES